MSVHAALVELGWFMAVAKKWVAEHAKDCERLGRGNVSIDDYQHRSRPRLSMRGSRVREHRCGSALHSSLPSTPPSPGHRPGVCPARSCCGPASQAEAGRVAPAPLDTVNSREPRRTLAFPPRLDAVNSPRGITSRPASPWYPVPTQQPQGRHEQCRAGGKRKLKGAEGRSWCAMPALL